MRIEVHSYQNASEFVKKNPESYWISVRDHGFDELYSDFDSNVNDKNVLKLKFDDVTPFQVHHDLLHPFHRKVLSGRDPEYISEKQVSLIKNFADKVNEKKEVLHVHCWAGKSRSRAIAYVLNIYYNLFMKKKMKEFKENNESILVKDSMPNPEVVRLMSTILFK